jgi:hypothetical protein
MGLLCVLADLAVESEAAMWMTMRIARALDRAETNRAEGLLSRTLYARREVLGQQARRRGRNGKRGRRRAVDGPPHQGGRTACDAGPRLRVQFVSSLGGSTSRLELEISFESPTTWPKAA